MTISLNQRLSMAYKCDACGKRFANASNLFCHKKIVHVYEIDFSQANIIVNGAMILY